LNPFSAIITPQSVSFTSPEGKVYNIDSTHKKWAEIIAQVKVLQSTLKALRDGEGWLEKFGLSGIEDHSVEEEWDALMDLVDDATKINEAGEGRVVVEGGIVYYEGEAIRSPLTERIIWGISEGFDMTAYMNFLDNAMDNPSKRAVDEMYSFMEQHSMGITEDGYILGYKRVKDDFKDIYTGTFDNSPGCVVTMKRNRVNDDARKVCSQGLHFCAMSYLPSYGVGGGNRIVIVKVNPRDIVSVPIDYSFAKVRCCEYTVLSEYEGDDKEDLLGTKAVWTDSDFSDSDDSSYGDGECDYCGYDTDECTCGADDGSDWLKTEDVSDDDDGTYTADAPMGGNHLEDDDGELIIDDDMDTPTQTMQAAAIMHRQMTLASQRNAELSQLEEEEAVALADEIARRSAAGASDRFADKNLYPDEINGQKFGLVGNEWLPVGPPTTDPLDQIEHRTAEIIKEADDEGAARRATEQALAHELDTFQAREKALFEFRESLAQDLSGVFKIWYDDSKLKNLPTNAEVQKLLGSLARELREAEIAAGDPKDFDWESWLKSRMGMQTENFGHEVGLTSEETGDSISKMFNTLREFYKNK
jgi:hypothetical protein